MTENKPLTKKEQILRFEVWAQIYRMLARDPNMYDHHLLREIYAYERNITNAEIIASYDLTRWSRIVGDNFQDVLNVLHRGLYDGAVILLNKFPPHKNTVYMYLQETCYSGNIQLVHLIIGYGAVDWNDGLQSACYGGHMNVVQLMISYGANHWDAGLYYACRGGHMEIVQYMISKGAVDWNEGLRGACRSGNIEIVRLMISQGADYWDAGLWEACEGGHLEIVNLMIIQGADDWNWGLYGACQGGHTEIMRLMINYGAQRCYQCDRPIAEHL